jgi:ferredoxin
MDEEEEERVEAVDRLALSSRLGCQSKVKGNVTVEIMNLDE